MSQFVFGEIITPYENAIVAIRKLDFSAYPFSIRFSLLPYDYYQQVSLSDHYIIPFVIADSDVDNTAEILLGNDCECVADERVCERYKQIISLSISDKVNLIAQAINNILGEVRASECILVFSSGEGNLPNLKYCNSAELAGEIIDLLSGDELFFEAGYHIVKNSISIAPP